MPAGVKCIYCKGSTSGVRKGEHIIPVALGGTLTLKCVCSTCNGDFSILDKELCSNSPLSLVVQQELGTESTTNWDYNEELDIAVEAKILPGFQSPMLWPQLVLLDKKVYFLFDQVEAESVGIVDYANAFHNLVQRCVERWHDKHKGIIWKRIRRHPDRGRFPPRFFCRREYSKWKRGMTFICRYFDPIDQEQIVHIVSGWKPVITRSTASTSLSVLNPEGFHTFEPELILRGLVKIGLNLLAHIHSHNAVNSDTFPMSIKYARLGTELTLDLNSNGFITNNTLQASNCPTKAHKFELSYLDNQWRFIAVFFGGLIGTCVHFPGPKIAEYIRYEIVVPIKSTKWTVKQSKIHLPAQHVRTVWDNLSIIIPSMPILHRGSRLRIEHRQSKKEQ